MKRGLAIDNLGRAPVPEWEEVARAAWPGRLPRPAAAAAGRIFLPVTALSFLLLVLAAWLRLPWLGLFAWTAGAVVEWLATPADTAVTRLLDLTGLRAPLRALLRSLPAAALVFGLGDAGAGIGYVIAVLFVQSAWVVQPAVATWLSRGAPPLRYLPGADRQPRPFTAHARSYARAVGTPGAAVVLELVALTAALGLGTQLLVPAVGYPVIAAVVLLAVAALAASGWAALRVRRAQPRWGEELLAGLTALEPVFLVYVSLAARQSRYIVNQWLPALDALPQDGVLLVREASQLAPLASTRHPVIYAADQKDVERLTLPSVRIAFYLAYGERNGQLLRDPRPAHVMLLHGDSDKATSANGLARAFDEVWVAGPAAVERYRAAGVKLADDRFVFIGRPQVAGLPAGPTGQQPPVVLYAPTFEGYYDQTAHTSLDVMGVELVRRLVADGRVRVWFRPHPASGVSRPSMLAAIAEIGDLLRTAPGDHLVAADQALTLPQCLAAADVLISDISSVASDFLATERPIITCDPDGLPADDFIATYPTQSASYLLHPGLAELDAVLAAALGDDPLRGARAAMRRRVFCEPPGGPQAAFTANVARLAASG